MKATGRGGPTRTELNLLTCTSPPSGFSSNRPSVSWHLVVFRCFEDSKRSEKQTSGVRLWLAETPVNQGKHSQHKRPFLHLDVFHMNRWAAFMKLSLGSFCFKLSDFRIQIWVGKPVINQQRSISEIISESFNHSIKTIDFIDFMNHRQWLRSKSYTSSFYF